ncbi:MAG: hypothetical protein K2K80_00075 [Clostridia bacterium]|nr:hypothetical protein [Clostridia bacterium]
MKYNYNIEIRNETDKDEIFNKYKQTVYDHIFGEISGSFNFDLDLLVVFKEIPEDKQFINEETYNAGTTLIEDRFAIILNILSLEKLPDDGGLDLTISICHELCHVYDLYLVTHNKYYSVNPLPYSQKSLKDLTISKGWLFWTEFHAYFLTYKYFNDEYSCPTFSQIVNGYEELTNQFATIQAIDDFESEESIAKIEKFKDNIDDFIYFTAKYLAGSIFKEKKNNTDEEQVTTHDFYEQVNNICYHSTSKLIPLLRKAHGMRLTKKLYNLGKYLLTNIYEEFNFFTIKRGDSILFAYCN